MYLVKNSDYRGWDDAYQGMFGRIGFAFSQGFSGKLVPEYEDNRYGHKIEFSPEFTGEIVFKPNGKILVWSNGRLIPIPLNDQSKSFLK